MNIRRFSIRLSVLLFLASEKIKSSGGLYSFVCRNVNVWNSLPDHVVNSDSVAIFKCRLSSLNLSSS